MEENEIIDGNQWTEDSLSLINATNALTTFIPSDLWISTPEPTKILKPPINPFHYIQFAFLVTITTVGFISNFLVLLLFYKRPTLRSFSNRFVLNLSLTHFSQCIFILPLTAASVLLESWHLGDAACAVIGFMNTTLNITSLLSLLLIALDRNCAVNSPLHYSMTITKKRTGFLIFLTWLLGVFVGCPPFFGVGEFRYRSSWHICTIKWLNRNPLCVAYASVLIVLGFMVPFVTTVCVYSSMFQAARDNSERARKHSVNSTSVDAPPPEAQSKTGVQKKKCRRWSSSSNQLFGEEWKAIQTGLLVVVTFTLCWLPYFTVTTLEAFFDGERALPNYMMFLVALCSSSACLINPYVYVFRNKNSRKQVKQMLCWSNLSNNKRWMFYKEGKEKCTQAGVNPCVLAASLVNEGSEKVKSLPALYQDMDGHWQVFSTSDDQSREEPDEIASNVSDDDFFDSGLKNISITGPKRKCAKRISNVQSIYNNTFNQNFQLKNIVVPPQPSSASKILLSRLRSNRDSTSSDVTDNCSMSLESNNSNEQQGDLDGSLLSRRGIGKYLFNTSEELWESRPMATYKRRNSAVDETSAHSESKKVLSSFGSARRKSFIHSHYRNKKSSETTLTSSTTSETLGSSSANSNKSSRGSRPKLVRQLETIEPPDGFELDERPMDN